MVDPNVSISYDADIHHGVDDMKFFQIAIAGLQPQGPLFESRPSAEREVRLLEADDRRYADEAMREAGIDVPPTRYTIHEVTR
jgi:hypothetical protein